MYKAFLALIVLFLSTQILTAQSKLIFSADESQSSKLDYRASSNSPVVSDMQLRNVPTQYRLDPRYQRFDRMQMTGFALTTLGGLVTAAGVNILSQIDDDEFLSFLNEGPAYTVLSMGVVGMCVGIPLIIKGSMGKAQIKKAARATSLNLQVKKESLGLVMTF
ncbi:MAG: hypothetical protein ABIV51_01560 [Saprospiraceae bacterium]